MTESSGSSGRRAENRAERQTWSVTRAIRRAISRGNAPPTRKDAQETDSRRRRNRRGTPGGCSDRGVGHDRKWPLPPWTDRGERGQFPGRYGIGVSILAARTWKKWGRTEDELTRYWGRLCSVEGQALECLGKARLTVTLGTRVIEWGFIVAEIGDDEGILGNDFAMAHELTVRPCEGAVYLPDHTGTGRGHLGERLPCTVRVVTEVRTVTEETLVVRDVGPATLAPHTVSQVRVIVQTPRTQWTVMADQGPGLLGLCPVRGIVEVEQASNIWLANPGSQPIQLDGDEVVALAECVLVEPGASAGSDRDVGAEVNGLVERASPHLTSEECRQLQTAMAARKHLFAKGKGDLGRTDIVQHQIHTGDQPAIKQRVRRYPAHAERRNGNWSRTCGHRHHPGKQQRVE